MTPTETMCEIIAALMWGPKFSGEIVAVTNVADNTVIRYLDALRASGIVRVAGEQKRNGTGRRQRLWEMQAHPYALPDWVKVQPPAQQPVTPAGTETGAPAPCTAAVPPAAVPGAQASAPALPPLPAAETP